MEWPAHLPLVGGGGVSRRATAIICSGGNGRTGDTECFVKEG